MNVPKENRVCTLINRLTGEAKKYSSLVEASISIKRSKNYIAICIQKERMITDPDGVEYEIKRNWEGKQWRSYDRADHRFQLCCYCKNSCGGCSWSRRFEPVEGWTAEPTIIRQRNRQGKYDIHSYKITECPQYEKG